MEQQSFQELREDLCQVCTLLYQRGYVASNDGNVSVRAGEGQILVTPSGVSKGRLTPDMLVLCDLEGRVLEGNRHPSSETPMHLLLYRERPDVGAVVHAHPAAATAFAACRRPLDVPYLTEVVSGLGPIPVAPYALPPLRRYRRASVPLSGTTKGYCWPTTAPSPGAATCGPPLTAWSSWNTRQRFTATSPC